MIDPDRLARTLAASLSEPFTLHRLGGEVDGNFLVRQSGKPAYLAKVSTTDRAAGLELETAVLDHLRQRRKQLALELPEPVGPARQIPGPEGTTPYWLRLQTWVAGLPLGDVRPRTTALRRNWGGVAGRLSVALQDFDHPHAHRAYRWDPSRCAELRPLQRYLSAEDRKLTDYFFDRFDRFVSPVLPTLRRSVNYNDAHEHNLLTTSPPDITGLIDFGDTCYTHSINELAIACAYAAMDLPDPLQAIREVTEGYHAAFPITEAEAGVLPDLIAARLLISVCVAAENARREPDNAYLQISARPALELLYQLRVIPSVLARAYVRRGAGYAGHPHRAAVIDFLGTNRETFAPVVPLNQALHPIDLGVGSRELGNYSNYEQLSKFKNRIEKILEEEKATLGVGGYGEVRPVYTTDAFAATGNEGPRWRTTHLGLDFWTVAGTPVLAPLDGRVHSTHFDPAPGSYGATLILEHRTAPDDGSPAYPFYTLYGHLDRASIRHLAAGAQVQRGTTIAMIGSAPDNGGWPPHLHFQLMLDMIGLVGDFPGVAYPEAADVWLDLCPNPQWLLPLLLPKFTAPARRGRAAGSSGPVPGERLRTRRGRQLGYGLSLSYATPLHVLRGKGAYLYDHTGRRYLDLVNNVAHVGHEHPAVVRAGQRQMAVLNTNTRYLHEEVVRLAEELTATLPEALSVVHFVNSGSEATELALRMAAATSGSREVIAVEAGYHGNTGRAIDVSHYKFWGQGRRAVPASTHIVPLPDTLRGLHRDPSTAGAQYAAYIAAACAELPRVGAFLCESILSCGGQIVLPAGYLAMAYAAVRAAGGVCIADEVQVGLGRVGEHFWGFELQGVVPDILTIGKPLGNGHPLGAVVCTPAVAGAFAATGIEYFNTFGGNPVSCAIGRAVLATVRKEGLQERALEMGNYLRAGLLSLREKYPLVADVRGHGLFLGLELLDAEQHPARDQANRLKNRMRDLGFLLSTDGPDENVFKFKPPLCVGRQEVDLLLRYLEREIGYL